MILPHAVPDSLRCWAEIDTGALRRNAAAAGRLTGGGPESVMAVVKADAYGHRLSIVAEALRDITGSFAVATLAEALEVARHGRRSDGRLAPVYILSPALPGEMDEIVRRGFIPAVSSLEEIRAFAASSAPSRPAPLHVEIDTGMGRMGVLPEDAAPLLEAITACPSLTLDSVSTHFPSSDEDEPFTLAQEARFRALLAAWRERFGPFRSHVANSAGILHYPREQGETVRAGLMLYGISPLPPYQSLVTPALTWLTRITLVRDLPAGWGISYGRTYVTDRPAVVATLAAGYGDGYPRQVSGQGAAVEIQGSRCPVLGRITMDQMMVDVSHLPQRPAPGDIAVLLGGSITAGEIAGRASTIPWHVLTGITDRTVRVPVTRPETPRTEVTDSFHKRTPR